MSGPKTQNLDQGHAGQGGVGDSGYGGVGAGDSQFKAAANVENPSSGAGDVSTDMSNPVLCGGNRSGSVRANSKGY